MMDVETELERLRAEVESYRQRELDSLRSQLNQALVERDHYRTEAARNAETGRQIHLQAQEEIQHLRSQLEIKEQTARSLRANAGRN